MSPASARLPAFLVTVFAAGVLCAAPESIDRLDVYRDQGIESADPARGRQLWYATANRRSCTSCHGATPSSSGRHVTTGKAIEPMAPSVNPERLQSAKNIEKWFLRNCNWTFGRKCSAQEKADILTWLAGQ